MDTEIPEAPLMDETRWERLMELFDRMLDGAEPTTVISSEPDPDIRAELIGLWEHHLLASNEHYLDAPVAFEVAPLFQPGRTLLNRFRIERLLGSGGMGEVYLAWDQRMEYRVALKTIARFLAGSDPLRRRFAAEVRSARRVTHPNVCRIHELFDEGEIAFFSMEYVDGVLLSDAFPLPPADLRPIVRQLAEGLHAAHREGVIHGDFKPSNIIVVSSGRVGEGVPRAVIMDFGLARAIEGTVPPVDSALSLRGGTMDYMAPELEAGGSPTVLSDIYAFGKVAQQLLPVESLWDDCTRSDPRTRPQSLEEILRRLDPVSTRRYWLGGIAVAALGATGYTLWPEQGFRLNLPLGTRLLVNGFRALSVESASARLARALLLTALQQSPRIHAIADQDLLPALHRVKPGAQLPLSGSLLKDLLARLRAPFFINGEVSQAAGRYSLDLSLVNADTGQPIGNWALRNEPGLTVLAQKAAALFRAAAGESAQSLSTNPSDVGAYTSQVPEALQHYYDAMDLYSVAQMNQALPVVEEAVRLDPDFAQAHCLLGLILYGAVRYEEGFRELTLAHKLSAKLPERERVAIEISYYWYREDWDNAIASARRALVLSPDEGRYHFQLGQVLQASGDAAAAADSCRRAIALNPDDWMPVLRLESSLVEQGNFSEVIDEFAVARSRKVTSPVLYDGLASAYLGLERYDDALAAHSREPNYSLKGPNVQAVVIMQGRLESAISNTLEQRAAARTPVDVWRANAFLAGLYYVTDRPAVALRHVADMAELPAVPPMLRYLQCTASWARRLGHQEALSRARAAVERVEAQWSGTSSRAALLYTSALEAWRRNSTDEAAELLVTASGKAFSVWTLFDLAELYTRQAKWEVAETWWDKFEAHRGTVFTKGWFPGILVLGWLNRAIAAQARGDRTTAFRYSKKVLDHWFRSNPSLHLVQAAKTINLSNQPI